MLESGPAAGVISAKYFGSLSGFENAIAFDMGGTTAKMGLIVSGEAGMVSEFEAGGLSGVGDWGGQRERVSHFDSGH